MRRAFTIIELLIVILVASILMIIVVTATTDWLGQSRKAATKATMKKIGEALKDRHAAFHRYAVVEYRKKWGRDFASANPSHALWKKSEYRRQFWILPAQGRPVTTNADRSEVLYQLIMNSQVAFGEGGHTRATFDASEVGDTDGDGHLEFIDAWGNPISYYAFPTRLFKPRGHLQSDPVGGVDPSARYRILIPHAPRIEVLNSDPDDPLEVLTPRHYNESTYHTYRTWYFPFAVSSGRDGALGLTGNLAAPARTEDLHDNISTHQ